MRTDFQIGKDWVSIVAKSTESNPIICVVTNFDTRRMSIDYADGHKDLFTIRDVKEVLINNSGVMITLEDKKNEN